MWLRRLSVFFLCLQTMDASADVLRVMSFNMMCGLCDPIEYGTWRERKVGFEDTLRRARPDLLAVQELMDGLELNTITHALPDLQAYYFDPGLPYLDSVVLFDRNRFELLHSGAFWLSAKPNDTIGWGWVPSVPRDVVWVELRDKKSGVEFYFAGTHMDNNRANKRPSAELIRRRLGAMRNIPVILAGDFNSRPGTDSFRMLSEPDASGRGFVNSFDLAGQHDYVANTPASWDYACTDDKPKQFPGCRIDHIFLSTGTDWSVSRYIVDMNRYGWRNKFVSDHRPILAEVSIRQVPTKMQAR